MAVATPLIDRIGDHPDDPRKDERRGFLRDATSQALVSTCSWGGSFDKGRITFSVKFGGNGASPPGPAGPANRFSTTVGGAHQIYSAALANPPALDAILVKS